MSTPPPPPPPTLSQTSEWTDNPPQYLSSPSSCRTSATRIRSLATNAVLMRLPVSAALSPQRLASIAARAHCRPSVTSEDLLSLCSDESAKISRSSL